MLPDPLHPAVVHFPIVLMFLLPLAALGALWAIRRGTRVRLAWALPVAVAGALALSSWVAVETGEGQAERAEDTVGEGVVEGHEEAAERFLAFSTAVFVITSLGFAGGMAGRSARALGTAGAFALIVAGYQVGHSGGRIVYGDASAAGLFSPGGSEAGQGDRGRQDDD